jgi:hypothetical protein
MRDVDARLAWFLANRPAAAGRCAEHVWHALGGPADPPRQGLPNATAVARLVQKQGHMRQGPCPRGAIRYWTGGADGHGHVGIEHADIEDPAAVASTDVGGPRTVGVRVLPWFASNWPKLKYAGWSWYWGAINTEPQEVDVPAPPYRNIKIEKPQSIPLNQWVTLDLGTVDAIVVPVGSNDWWVQVHLDLGKLTGAGRNDLRYLKGRWARHLAAGDLDTHGTDTAAISPDLPKGSWQSSFSTDMKGLAGVPVSFQVYVGSMKDGTVVSPMRLYTVEDETT